MPEVTYRCYFDDWSQFMDGDLIIGDTCVAYDFISQKQADYETSILNSTEHGAIILTPFNEEEARNVVESQVSRKNQFEQVFHLRKRVWG